MVTKPSKLTIKIHPSLVRLAPVEAPVEVPVGALAEALAEALVEALAEALAEAPAALHLWRIVSI